MQFKNPALGQCAMQSIFISLFPLIGLILSGHFLKKKNVVSEGFWLGAEKLNYYILFPAMLFANLAQANIDLAMINSMLLLCGSMLVISCAVLYAIRKIYRIRSYRFGVYTQSNIRFNTYIGLAIVAAMFHQQGMTLFAIILAISIPIVNVISVLALTQQDAMNIRQIGFSLLKNPLIMSCIAGAGFNLSGFQLWSVFEAFLKQFAVCSLPLGLLCVGAALQFTALKKDLRPLLINTISRLLILPALAYILCKVFDLSQLETQVFVLFFALPTASASYILTKVLGGDSQLMAGIISLQTLCSALTIPLVLSFLI